MKLSKAYLESVCTDELLQLAEIYGIFVPKDLNRNFIINELLEIEEAGSGADMLLYEEDTETLALYKGLPDTYNTSEIAAVLKDPMWVFVFWDFSKADFKKITEDTGFKTFALRVLFFEKKNLEPYDRYEIEVKKNDRSRYIHLSFDDSAVRIDICALFSNKKDKVIAHSNMIELKRGNIPLRLGTIEQHSDTVYFEGLSILKKVHFKNYRQAFNR